MTSKIRILDEKTINQIAAGEVIENPASVLKELVDNALDAGATKIVVEAENSGRQLLRVKDNGSGMSHDDALLCIERHATSKIRSLEDLWQLETMGFRGEALSSIASISEFSLLTGMQKGDQEQVEGSSLRISGGKIVSHQHVKCLAGTQIDVKSLFFNVPARKKFQKSPTRDASDIVKVLLQLGLSHPDVAFELILNHSREFSWQKTTLEERIKQALGREFFSELLKLEYENELFVVSGYIGKPHFVRPTRSHQYLFVNRRPVHSLAISSAVKEAYGSSIDPTKHPAMVLFVDIKPEALDVNVHPQKREVRFSSIDEITKGIIQAVTSSLFLKQEPLPSPKAALSFSFGPTKVFHEMRPEPTAQPMQMLFEEVEQRCRVHAVYDDFIIADITFGKTVELPQELSSDGLYLVSAKRALARLVFDGPSLAEKCSMQTLLVPIFIELSLNEAIELGQMLPSLEKAGFLLREFGAASYLVEGIPSYLEPSIVEDIIRSLLGKELHDDIPLKLSHACAKTRPAKSLSREEAVHVVEKLLRCNNPFYCPHHEKIITMLTKQELEKKFR